MADRKGLLGQVMIWRENAFFLLAKGRGVW